MTQIYIKIKKHPDKTSLSHLTKNKHRYLSSQEYKQHFDAFDLATEDGRRFAENGGQRVATVRSYV